MYINEKKLYDISKQNKKYEENMNMRENQDLVNKNVQMSYDREDIFKNRYKNFHKFQDKVANEYMKNVYNAEREKQAERDRRTRAHMKERDQKLDEMERYKQSFYQNWQQSNKSVILNQMNHKNDVASNDRYKVKRDQMESYIKQDEVNSIDLIEQQQKKMMQSKYKEMLDSQRKIKQEYKAYGTMTDVEKSLNRNDLIAWKNYDYTTYAMIPGFNSQNLQLSNKVEAERARKQKTRDIEKEEKRLKIYTTDLNKVRNELAQNGAASLEMFQSPNQFTTPNKIHVPKQANLAVAREGQYRNGANSELQRNYSLDAVDRNKGPATVYRANHPKYVKHHLYGSYNPINGSFNNETSSPLNKSIDNFKLNNSYAF